jgi:hypothetical protein
VAKRRSPLSRRRTPAARPIKGILPRRSVSPARGARERRALPRSRRPRQGRRLWRCGPEARPGGGGAGGGERGQGNRGERRRSRGHTPRTSRYQPGEATAGARRRERSAGISVPGRRRTTEPHRRAGARRQPRAARRSAAGQARQRPPHPHDTPRPRQRRRDRAAKRRRNRRVPARDDRRRQSDVVGRAGEDVRAHGGSAGVDGVGLAAVERGGSARSPGDGGPVRSRTVGRARGVSRRGATGGSKPPARAWANRWVRPAVGTAPRGSARRGTPGQRSGR